MGEFSAVFQNQPVDVSEEFSKQENHFFVGEKVSAFDPASGSGEIPDLRPVFPGSPTSLRRFAKGEPTEGQEVFRH